jgi:hypothetical protein
MPFFGLSDTLLKPHTPPHEDSIKLCHESQITVICELQKNSQAFP